MKTYLVIVGINWNVAADLMKGVKRKTTDFYLKVGCGLNKSDVRLSNVLV